MVGIPTFMDISVDMQVQELLECMKSLGADIKLDADNDATETSIQQNLGRVITVCDVAFTTSCSEADIEGILYSIVSVIVMFPEQDMEVHIIPFCDKLSTAPPRYNNTYLKALMLLFHGLPEVSPLRYNVFYEMVILAGQLDTMKSVYTGMANLRKQFIEPRLSTEQLQNLLRQIHTGLIHNHSYESASEVMVELLKTYTEDTASSARDDAQKCITSALADPATFLLDHLLSLKPVKFLEGEPIHDLLTIFVTDTLEVYLNFYENNKDFIKSIGLDHDKNVQKMRILSLINLATQNAELTFKQIADELHIDETSVEEYVIQGVKTKLLAGRMDQTNRKMAITSATHRTFGRTQWQQVRNVLSTWRGNLQKVEENLQTVLTTEYEMITTS